MENKVKFKINNKGRLALAQITLLIFGIIAFGWILGSEVEVVSGATPPEGKYKGLDGNIYTITSGGLVFKTMTNGETITSSEAEYYSAMDPEGGWNKKSPAVVPNTANSITYTPVKGSKIWDPSNPDVKYDSVISSDGKTGYRLKNGKFVEAKISADGTLVENVEGIWNGMGVGFLGHLAEGVQWSVFVVGAIQLIGNLAGWDSKKTNAASVAAFGGIMAAKGFIGAVQQWANDANWLKEPFFAKGSTFGDLGITNAGFYGTVIGIVVAAAIFYAMYEDEETETIFYTCEQWQAPTGGDDCEECNKQGILPCSEYQCRSLGQSCQLINKGTDDEKCTWVNRKDVTPPVISLWKDALSKNFSYLDDKAVSPPDTGTKIIYKKSEDGCMPAFTPLEFGILTDEPAQCKLDYQRGTSIKNMSYYFGGTSSFLYNHSQVMSLPGSDNLAEENITLKNGGEYSLFVRCTDSNGNANVATFAFRFCVDDGPDTTPPVIVGTNVLSGMPVAYNQSTLDLKVYTNEPATCKWSHGNDNDYEDMDNKMTCSSSVFELNAQMVYECKTKLTGIKNEQENNYFIRCEDQPLADESDRNKNSESYEFNVIGTKQLAIDYVRPNGTTIKDSTESVKVTLEAKTLEGYDEGNSTCYYNGTEDTEGIMFYNTSSYYHSQDLWLPQGNYVYTIKCVDLGGNADRADASFSVETDVSSPIVVRVYKEESYLNVITNEPSKCVYGINDCTYSIDDGTAMTSTDKNNTHHYTSWDTDKTFYIKCEDKYGTEPSPNECSIILKPSEEMIVQN